MAQVFIIPSSRVACSVPVTPHWRGQWPFLQSIVSPEAGSGQCQQPRPGCPGLPGSGGCLRPQPLPPPASQKLPRMAITEGRAGWGGGRENLKMIQLIHSDTHPWSQTFNLHFLPWIEFNWNYIFSTNFAETSNSATSLPPRLFSSFPSLVRLLILQSSQTQSDPAKQSNISVSFYIKFYHDCAERFVSAKIQLNIWHVAKYQGWDWLCGDCWRPGQG